MRAGYPGLRVSSGEKDVSVGLGSGFEAFESALREQLGGTIAELQPAYTEDPRKITKGSARLLLRPESTGEVARVVALANAHRVPLVPFAGGTGLVGGQVQDEHENAVLVSVEKLDGVGEPNLVDHSIKVGAGAILEDIQAKARSVGLLFPLSLASEGSCRIGGNLATNAGGVNVVRYGNARDLCLGIEAVMADGSVYHGLKALRKDNTGYDLRHLLIGSEGTLGIITAARLKLFSAPRQSVTALFNIPSPESATELLSLLRSDLGDAVCALELIGRTGLEFLGETMPSLPMPPTGNSPWLTLVEVATVSSGDLKERFEASLAQALERGIVTDGHIAQSDTQRNVIWTMRESIPQANSRIGSISSHDISVPIVKIPAFIEAGREAIAKHDPSYRINCFGHVGDGNLHYNVFPPAGSKRGDWAEERPRVKAIVHGLVHEFGGSISAEHGIGRHKREDLEKYGDPAKIAAIRAIKRALDPNNILNPGAVIEA